MGSSIWPAIISVFHLTPIALAGDEPELRDLFSDTWGATDGLGRKLPLGEEVGPPRPDRTVGIFYFLWHGAHIQGGPYDVSKILAQDPQAMEKPGSPLWGPLHAPHHWGESIFGYYRTDDEGVLRQHARMLANAGVDTVIFDVTNQATYPEEYRALLKVWSRARAQGNRTPRVAFLTPFWDPPKVVRELWRDLYSPGLHRELWFEWDGKPLILADRDLLDAREDHPEQNVPVELLPGHTLAQEFRAEKPFRAAGGRFPTWKSAVSAVTLTLRWGDPKAAPIASRRFTAVADNAWLMLPLERTLPPGAYRLEASEPAGKIGWWSHTADVQPSGRALADGQSSGGDRTLRLSLEDAEAARIRDFFTFRKPQPDYFQGPSGPDQWSWLEVHPQHVFRNARGEKEQMSVGVAQNAVGGRLGSMSEPGARGRSSHGGSTEARPGSVNEGLNFAEEWERALREDPRFVFVTGWNEWIAGRFAEFNGIRLPVMFVDQFDEEHSRDIEPMKGGHEDHYYWQLVSAVRRYKGARPVPAIQPAAIRIDGRFDDWKGVGPEFRDGAGDPVQRDHRGWDPRVTYRNDTGRNDLLSARVSFDAERVYFQVRAAAPLSPPEGKNWMLLFLDVDTDGRTGWLGHDFVVNRTAPRSLERWKGPGYEWERIGAVELEMEMAGDQLELAIPWKSLGREGPPPAIDFKWADHIEGTGDWSDFTLNGDSAPDDRFNYRARFPGGTPR